MSEPQDVTGLMDQIHELKTQLADAERNAAAQLARMTLAARAASMYLPEPERTNFRREYGLGEATL